MVVRLYSNLAPIYILTNIIIVISFGRERNFLPDRTAHGLGCAGLPKKDKKTVVWKDIVQEIGKGDAKIKL
mgnify:CR=1 FL=1